MTREFGAFMWQLGHPDDATDATTFADESDGGETGIVLLTTRDIAAELGCSEQWARHVARSIGTQIGRQWVVEAKTFDSWRTA